MKAIIFFLVTVFCSVVSGQSDICPSTVSILPCLCEEIDERPSVECSQINDEDELERIFSADFPDPAIEVFTLTDSLISGITRNVFGNVSFNNIYIRTDYLSTVSVDAFENSEDTLRNLEIINCPITEDSFPLENLESYTEIIQLTLRNNLLTEFPTIVSESLRFLFILDNTLISELPTEAIATAGNVTSLDLEGCGITTLDNAAFRGAEEILYLSLRGNSVTSIRAAFFTFLPFLLDINLSNNQISEIPTGTFAPIPAVKTLNLAYNNIDRLLINTFLNNAELENINLLSNEIDYISRGTFDLLPSLELLDLGYNNLTTLVTGTFEAMVNESIVFVDNNKINYIEANAFGNIANSDINLIYNELDNIYEYWLRPLLDEQNYVYLSGNPIPCGCEISWLFEDSSYQQLVSGRCPNGTLIDDLNPAYYQQNC